MDRGRFYCLSYDYMCVLCKRHTLHLFKLLLVRIVSLLQWILISVLCFYTAYCEFWSKCIKWTNNGEIISVRQHICKFYRQKYSTDSDYIFYSALLNSISLGECNLPFFVVTPSLHEVESCCLLQIQSRLGQDWCVI